MQTLVEKVVRSLENIGSFSRFVRFAAIGVACLAVFAGVSASAADLYVSTNDVHAVEGSDLGWGTYKTDDGVSHDAYTNLQQAVNAAAKGDTVWVEDGFVCDDANGSTKTGDYTKDNVKYDLYHRLYVPRAITLRGRSGTWENGPVIRGKWQDGWEEKATEAERKTGAIGFDSVGGVCWDRGSRGTLLGFRIENCAHIGPGVESSVAYAGLVKNCLISGDRADYRSVECREMQNCVISNGYNGASAVTTGVTNIVNTLFINNVLSGSNGRFCSIAAGAVVSNCTFVGNTTPGARDIISFSSRTTSGGKGLLVGCVFTNNSTVCVGHEFGSGYVGVVSNCVFVGNTKQVCSLQWAANNANYGGHRVDFYNCKVTDNTTAGTLFFGSSGGLFYNCLFARNKSTSTDAATSFFRNPDTNSPVALYNCTFADNVIATSCLATGNVYAVNTIFSGDAFLLGATNCCLAAASEGVSPGSGNVFADDPMLVASGEKMYRPKSDSPCRGAGSLTAYALPAHDLSGRPRLTGGLVSIGCYEPHDNGFLLIVR